MRVVPKSRSFGSWGPKAGAPGSDVLARLHMGRDVLASFTLTARGVLSSPGGLRQSSACELRHESWCKAEERGCCRPLQLRAAYLAEVRWDTRGHRANSSLRSVSSTRARIRARSRACGVPLVRPERRVGRARTYLSCGRLLLLPAGRGRVGGGGAAAAHRRRARGSPNVAIVPRRCCLSSRRGSHQVRTCCRGTPAPMRMEVPASETSRFQLLVWRSEPDAQGSQPIRAGPR